VSAPDSDGAAEVRDELLRPLAVKLEGLHSIERLTRLSGGVSRETWSLDAITATDTIPLILRRPSAGVPGGEDLSLPLPLEGHVLRCAAAHGVPAPRVVAHVGEGFLMDRVAGETIAQRILGEERFANARGRLLDQCAAALAGLRRVPAGALPSLPTRRATDLVKAHERMYRSMSVTRPILEVGFRWLEDHLPVGGDTGLVHGDFRLGNLVVNDEGLASLLDWELAHFGDPMEDLGWFCTNAWRFNRPDRPAGGLGSREALCAAYEKAGGPRTDLERVRFWEIFGCIKWAVISMRFANRHLSGAHRSIELLAIGRRTAEAEIDLMNLLSS
jgi:aminoglycoside phosphotransferase (APT) family kinase protein